MTNDQLTAAQNMVSQLRTETAIHRGRYGLDHPGTRLFSDAANMLDAFIEEAVKPPVPVKSNGGLEHALNTACIWLETEATMLDQWAKESKEGGWSTHQVTKNKIAASDNRARVQTLRTWLAQAARDQPAPVVGLTIKDALEQMQALAPECTVNITMECSLYAPSFAMKPGEVDARFSGFIHLPNKLVGVYARSLVGIVAAMRAEIHPPDALATNEINALVATLPGAE